MADEQQQQQQQAFDTESQTAAKSSSPISARSSPAPPTRAHVGNGSVAALRKRFQSGQADAAETRTKTGSGASTPSSARGASPLTGRRLELADQDGMLSSSSSTSALNDDKPSMPALSAGTTSLLDGVDGSLSNPFATASEEEGGSHEGGKARGQAASTQHLEGFIVSEEESGAATPKRFSQADSVAQVSRRASIEGEAPHSVSSKHGSSARPGTGTTASNVADDDLEQVNSETSSSGPASSTVPGGSSSTARFSVVSLSSNAPGLASNVSATVATPPGLNQPMERVDARVEGAPAKQSAIDEKQDLKKFGKGARLSRRDTEDQIDGEEASSEFISRQTRRISKELANAEAAHSQSVSLSLPHGNGDVQLEPSPKSDGAANDGSDDALRSHSSASSMQPSASASSHSSVSLARAGGSAAAFMAAAATGASAGVNRLKQSFERLQRQESEKRRSIEAGVDPGAAQTAMCTGSDGVPAVVATSSTSQGSTNGRTAVQEMRGVDASSQDSKVNSGEGIEDTIKRSAFSSEEWDGPPGEELGDESIDWNFWGRVMNDYQDIARSHPRELSRAIQAGIPAALRGMMWQLMSCSKDEEMEIIYAYYLKQTSTHEKNIRKDLARTFPEQEYFRDGRGIGQENLFNVIKAYSLYDEECGYCQGMQFVVGPLLLNMPDEEAFSTLVRLMKSYDLRGHFIPNMPSLQLRLFQFDRLLEEMLPLLHRHLLRQGVKSSMYASGWFMTLFTYRTPLEIVYRILDSVFAEGIEALFRFALTLMHKNEERLLQLGFEDAVPMLAMKMFDSYKKPEQAGEGDTIDEKGQSLKYRVNEFVRDAFKMRITPFMLDQYAAEFDEQVKAANAHRREVDALRLMNRNLSARVKELEEQLTQVNAEHVDLVKSVVMAKLAREEMAEELVRYKMMVAEASLAEEGRRASSMNNSMRSSSHQGSIKEAGSGASNDGLRASNQSLLSTGHSANSGSTSSSTVQVSAGLSGLPFAPGNPAESGKPSPSSSLT